jgi:formylglycine-generating enzyme required for sulfatase activity
MTTKRDNLTRSETVTVAASRKAEVAARRRSRILNAALYTMLVGIIIGLVGWIKQGYLTAQWRWYTWTRPYAAAHVWPYVLSLAEEKALKPGASFEECAQDCPQMAVVPAGTFEMGSLQTDKSAQPNEWPQHQVRIANLFAVSKYELTFADWDACVAGGGCNGYMPSQQGWGGGKQPVINVSFGRRSTIRGVAVASNRQNLSPPF